MEKSRRLTDGFSAGHRPSVPAAKDRSAAGLRIPGTGGGGICLVPGPPPLARALTRSGEGFSGCAAARLRRGRLCGHALALAYRQGTEHGAVPLS
jgi:hypothetical protein